MGLVFDRLAPFDLNIPIKRAITVARGLLFSSG